MTCEHKRVDDRNHCQNCGVFITYWETCDGCGHGFPTPDQTDIHAAYAEEWPLCWNCRYALVHPLVWEQP